MLHFLSDGHAVARLYGWATTTSTPPNNVKEAIEALSNLDLQKGGHVTVIVGAKWSSSKQCYLYTVNDPEGTNLHNQYTYQELVYNSTYKDGKYEVSFWFPTVVTKTEYSNKTTFGDILSEDYSSN